VAGRLIGAGVGRTGGRGSSGARFGRILGTGVYSSGGRGGNGTARRGTLAKAVLFGVRGGGWPGGSEKQVKISFCGE